MYRKRCLDEYEDMHTAHGPARYLRRGDLIVVLDCQTTDLPGPEGLLQWFYQSTLIRVLTSDGQVGCVKAMGDFISTNLVLATLPSS